MKPKLHQRFDFASISGKPTRTPQGFLRIDAHLTRVGVLLYRNDDGTLRRELRHPDEVFNPASMQTLGGAPVTDLHPGDGLVDPSNFQKLNRGHVGEAIEHDKKFVSAPVIVADQALIKKVEDGERRELSPGYTCKLDETPGTFRGEKYDAIQREIVYNHLAIGPKGWGRSGSEVSLHMDSGLVSFESKVTTDPHNIANMPERSQAVGQFVRAKLADMDKSTGHLAEELGVDVWAVEAFLDGFWEAIQESQEFLKDPDGKKTPSTGLAKMPQFTRVAKFLDVEPQTLFDLVPVAERGDGRSRTTKRTIRRDQMEEITFGGETFQVPSGIAEALKAKLAQPDAATPETDAAKAEADAKKAADAKAAAAAKDAEDVEKENDAKKAADAKKATDAANARADAAAVEIAALKKTMSESASPAKVQELVKARTSLEGTARRVVGDSADFDGKTDREVKIAVITHTDSAFDAEGKSDEYIQARYDASLAQTGVNQKRSDDNDAVARAAALANRQSSNGEPDAEKSRNDAAARSQKEWQSDLTATKAKPATAN